MGVYGRGGPWYWFGVKSPGGFILGEKRPGLGLNPEFCNPTDEFVGPRKQDVIYIFIWEGIKNPHE